MVVVFVLFVGIYARVCRCETCNHASIANYSRVFGCMVAPGRRETRPGPERRRGLRAAQASGAVFQLFQQSSWVPLMDVCAYAHTYKPIVGAHSYARILVSCVSGSMRHVYMYVCVCVCVYAYVFVCCDVSVFVFVLLCICLSVCVCVYECACVCLYICVCVCVQVAWSPTSTASPTGACWFGAQSPLLAVEAVGMVVLQSTHVS